MLEAGEPVSRQMKVEYTPFADQKPGTSGLRKQTSVFMQPHYTESFVQAIVSAIAPGARLVIGGDGRFYSPETIQKTIQICAANGITELLVARNGILSTPTASFVIRKEKLTGGILLTASHNPGGIDADFGIKYNMANGGPATEVVTDRIYEISRKQDSYSILETSKIDISVIQSVKVADMLVTVFDGVEPYVTYMRQLFDFSLLKSFLASRSPNFLLFDAMHAVTGPYATQIFVDALGLPSTCVMNAIPLADFGGGHPDPNLTYAKELVGRVRAEGVGFGAASDGDGDRNMILSNDAFVNPSDSIAVICAHASAIKSLGVLKGAARSMPTSGALDRVAAKLGIGMFEVPTGWKFFGNLMDAGLISICGEESFGTGSDHVREKDGIWAVLCWLSILATQALQDPATSVKKVLEAHYKIFGRNYFSRYDYENLSLESANQVYAKFQQKVTDTAFIGEKFGGHEVSKAGNFRYVDPVDKSVSSNQGLYVIFGPNRIVLRLSGTGSSGATIRFYFERFEESLVDMEAADAMREVIKLGLDESGLIGITGRDAPTVFNLNSGHYLTRCSHT